MIRHSPLMIIPLRDEGDLLISSSLILEWFIGKGRYKGVFGYSIS
jgi:hypothetical protein